ncbi:thioredoxin [Flavobacterium amniphilum]|uniref:thioredoxin n=1 Tax=Flavobacterium amniphilum TaxID=1834035 RepID=UPI002029CF89|nr:thioredoxin [Flavobacterium amniphilum]MCL9805072.1 thioredoxin [Flavobacterium amniphilum]
MKNVILSTLIMVSAVFTACKGQNDKAVTNLEPKVFAEKIAASGSAQLLDVRTPEEFSVQHLDNAMNININHTGFDKEVAQLDKNKPVYVYCLAGGRSSKAANHLAELGFKEVYNMEGGITKWNASGLGKPVKNNEGITLEQYQKLVKSDKKVLIDFYAEWCGPCKKMAPYMEKMKAELKDELVIIKIDADKNQELAQQLQIQGLPTLILYKKGEEIWKNLGFINEADLKAKL